jgi:hypothetical protein
VSNGEALHPIRGNPDRSNRWKGAAVAGKGVVRHTGARIRMLQRATVVTSATQRFLDGVAQAANVSFCSPPTIGRQSITRPAIWRHRKGRGSNHCNHGPRTYHRAVRLALEHDVSMAGFDVIDIYLRSTSCSQ